MPRMPSEYPQLAQGERVLAESTLGGDVAVLTDRRLVLTGDRLEQSLPLAHLALVRVRFERMQREIIGGAVMIVIALVLFAITGPTRAFIATQTAALDASLKNEQTVAAAGPSPIQKVGGVLDSITALVPWIAFVLFVLGGVRIGFGVYGRTVVTVGAGASEVEFERRGYNVALAEFAKEVGRHLPAPRRG